MIAFIIMIIFIILIVIYFYECLFNMCNLDCDVYKTKKEFYKNFIPMRMFITWCKNIIKNYKDLK
jgi:hypothetical protein